MTAAEKLRQEGIKVGIQKGMQKVAQKMLLQNKTVQEIIQLTDLTEEEIAEIKKSLKQ